MKETQKEKGLFFYQTKKGAVELRGDFSNNTIWASLDPIAQMFGRDKSGISRHINNICKPGELNRSRRTTPVGRLDSGLGI
jgi:hypothetical protein